MHLNQILQQRNISAYRLWKESGVPQATISDTCMGKTLIKSVLIEKNIFKPRFIVNISNERATK